MIPVVNNLKRPSDDRFDAALPDHLKAFKSFGLSEADYAFHDRKDSKFILKKDQLALLLELLQASFCILKIEDVYLQAYESLYFDTAQFDLYKLHHNAVLKRFKVRERSYLSTGERFLEVKLKSSKARTQKIRMPLKGSEPELKTSFLKASLKEAYETFQASLLTRYQRISLMKHQQDQRLTIDLGLELSDPLEKRSFDLGQIVIVELKEERHASKASFEMVRRQLGLQESSFSKYCVGCALVYRDLKQNQFKPLLSKLRRLQSGF